MIDPKSAAGQALAKAASKPVEPEQVEATLYTDTNGKRYFALQPKTQNCMTHATKKMVLKSDLGKIIS